MNSIPSKNFPKSRGKRFLQCSLCGFALLIFSGISPAQDSKGILEIRLKDHREAIGDFSRFEIAIDTIRISPRIELKFWQMGWKELKPSRSKVDLTKYTGKTSARIFRGEMAPGAFEAIHLKLSAIEGILKKDKSKVTVKNSLGPIKLAFSVRPKDNTLLILDLMVLDLSDHPPRGYELHLKGYEVYNGGKLVEKIPPA